MMILFSILLSFAQAMPAWTSQLTDANYEYHLDALVDEFDAFWFEENHKYVTSYIGMSIDSACTLLTYT